MSNRILNFADGFTSTTAPLVSGSVQENYIIANNTSGGAILTIDKTTCKCAFVDYELKRSDSIGSYAKTGSMIVAYNTAWALTEGNYQGDDMDSGVSSTVFAINSSTGAITFTSGNMIGTGYLGTFKISIVRVL